MGAGTQQQIHFSRSSLFSYTIIQNYEAIFFSLKKDERKNPTNTHTTNGQNKSEKWYFKFKNDFSIKISTRMVVNWIVTNDITFVTLLIIQSLRLQLGS